MAVTQVSNLQNILTAIGAPKGTKITYSGDAKAVAISDQPLAHFPGKQFSNFVVLSSGIATEITQANTSGSQGTDLGAPGAAGDTATLSLTIPVSGGVDSIAFDFTFLSEEYPEFVGSTFNDFFSVKLNGVETALDTSKKPITVNNNFFSKTLVADNTFFDGETPPLHIQVALPVNATTVQLDLQISDVGDGIYDSAAFFTNLKFPSTQTVFVSFAGGDVTWGHGAAKGTKFTLPGMAASVATDKYKSDVINELNLIYTDYRINFTSTKPASGSYSTVYLGGAGATAAVPKIVGVSSSVTGKADQIDVGNQDHADTAIVLTENYGKTPTFLTLAQTIAHETGHLLGLYHVNDAAQIMYYAASDTAITIGGNSTLKEFTGKSEDSKLELTNSLGLKNGATLLDQATTISATLQKQFNLNYGNLQTKLYDAQIAVVTSDAETPPAYVNLGNMAPGAIGKAAVPIDPSAKFVLMAKSSETGTYDVFSTSNVNTAGGAVNGSDLSKYGVSLPSDTGSIAFQLASISASGTATQVGSVSANYDTKPIYVKPLTVSDFLNKPATATLGELTDFDGNHLGGAGSWKTLGQADVQNDGDIEYILTNKELGRWATLGPDTMGFIDLANNSWGGDTRVVGTYIDPLITQGLVVKGSVFDSQVRFANDLKIDNIRSILGTGDYNGDGLQEVYFGLTDHTAFLHSFMHADGNIQYANYQSTDQMRSYLQSQGYGSEVWGSWT